MAGVLCPVLVHFHHMEPGLVLVEGLENHHLEIQLKKIKKKKKLKKKQNEDCASENSASKL